MTPARRWGCRLVLPAICLAGGVWLEAEQASRPTTGRRTATEVVCASDLGPGLKTQRRFCDVLIATTAGESVSMRIPPRTGDATLQFDLHNRFVVPATADLAQAFTRHTAVVSVIRPTGEVIDRAAVSRDYRTLADLFDRLSGGRGAPPKSIAPGQALGIRVTVPPGIASIGIVGTRLEEWRANSRGTWDSPGRPIAIVSNLRIEYTLR